MDPWNRQHGTEYDDKYEAWIAICELDSRIHISQLML